MANHIYHYARVQDKKSFIKKKKTIYWPCGRQQQQQHFLWLTWMWCCLLIIRLHPICDRPFIFLSRLFCFQLAIFILILFMCAAPCADVPSKHKPFIINWKRSTRIYKQNAPCSPICDWDCKWDFRMVKRHSQTTERELIFFMLLLLFSYFHLIFGDYRALQMIGRWFCRVVRTDGSHKWAGTVALWLHHLCGCCCCC